MSEAAFAEVVLRDLEKLDTACLDFIDADRAKPRDLQVVMQKARHVDACKAELLSHDLLRLDALAMKVLQAPPGEWAIRLRVDVTDAGSGNIEQMHRRIRCRHLSLLNLTKLLHGKGSDNPPLNPLPATIDALQAQCEKHRRRIMDAMRDGQQFHAGTNANFVARLFDAAVALDLGNAPAFPGEPQTGRDAVAALDTLLAWCRLKMQPAPTRDKGIKEPSKDAIACYRLSIINGGSQSDLAVILSRELGRPISQPQVSRWLKEVNAWRKAGNVLPDLPADSGAKPKVVRLDPAKIDRRDGKKSETRPPRRSDDESAVAAKKAELERLIAEQKGEDDYKFDPIQDDD